MVFFSHFHDPRFETNIVGHTRGVNIVSVHLEALPPQEKVLNLLTHVWHGCGMQFEMLHSLYLIHSVVACFSHVHDRGFRQTLPNWVT